MRTVVVFETAQEYFKACRQDRMEGNDFPFVPQSVTVLIANGVIGLSGEGSEKFKLADGINYMDMVEAAFALAEAKVMFVDAATVPAA